MRHLTWVILTFVLAAFLVIIVMSSAATSGFANAGIPDSRSWSGGMLTLSSLIAIISGIITFVGLIRNRKVMSFTDEVIGEVSRVTWPTREETVRASIIVVFTTLFVAALLAAYDYIWKNLADYFFLSGMAGS